MTGDDKTKFLPALGMVVLAISLGFSLGWIFALPFLCVAVMLYANSSQDSTAKDSEPPSAS